MNGKIGSTPFYFPLVIEGLSPGMIWKGDNGREGYDAITFELVDKIEGARADIAFSEIYLNGRKAPFVRNVTVQVSMERALELGTTYEAIGHELRHLTWANRILSPDPFPGTNDQYHTPQEADARSWGITVRTHYGY